LKFCHAHLSFSFFAQRRRLSCGWILPAFSGKLIRPNVITINYITKDVHPIISIHGKDDTDVLFSHALNLHDKLNKAEAKHRLVAIKGGEHMGFTKDQFQYIYEQIFAFLGTHLE
jgi:pimeloyl-ACP methyl ester carboxylesterase